MAATLLLAAALHAQSFPDPKAGGGHIPVPPTTDPIAVPAPHTGDMGTHRLAQPSTFLTVTLAGKDHTFRLSDLQALPQQTVTAMNGHTKAEESFTGPSVVDVLHAAGLPATPAAEHAMLHQIVVATGTDGYFVVYSAAELVPAFSPEPSIIALTSDGKPLVVDGSFKLVHAGERKPARWVRNVVGLNLRDVTQ